MGKKEKCSGDPARRIGNEYLFQEQAKANIEAFNDGGVTKIVSNCPHCFNTIKNEYPQLGGKFEIVHHSMLIPQLIEQGKIKFKPDATPKKVVFHDSCYMGRHNDVYDEPRAALAAIPGVQLGDIDRQKKLGMCCGAGGARMFMEEKIGTRVNNLRVDQLLEAQPEVIASSCPFCMTMLSDGVKAKDMQVPVRTLDIAEMVAAAMVVSPPAADEIVAPAEAF